MLCNKDHHKCFNTLYCVIKNLYIIFRNKDRGSNGILLLILMHCTVFINWTVCRDYFWCACSDNFMYMYIWLYCIYVFFSIQHIIRICILIASVDYYKNVESFAYKIRYKFGVNILSRFAHAKRSEKSFESWHFITYSELLRCRRTFARSYLFTNKMCMLIRSETSN